MGIVIPPNVISGSPEWWLQRLTQKLMDRQARYDKNENYVLGKQRPPMGDRRYVKGLEVLQKTAKTNYLGMITQAPVDRMRVKGFRFGEISQADEDAAKVWDYNDLDLQSKILHLAAATFGDAYALVLDPDKNSFGQAIVTIEDPRNAIVEPDPKRPMKSLAGLRLWGDILLQRVMAVLYLPGKKYTYEGPGLNEIKNLEIGRASCRERV